MNTLRRDIRLFEIASALAALLAASVVATQFVGYRQSPAELLPHICHIQEPDGGQGSGVMFTRFVDGEPRGYVLTAAHVVSMTKSNDAWRPVQLTFPTMGDRGRVVGRYVLQGQVIRYCPRNDLALIRVLGDTKVSCVRLASEGGGPELGDKLFILANPHGLDGFASLTHTILSFKHRDNEDRAYEQIQGGVVPGSSGGGVFDERGRLVGVVQKIYHPIGLIALASPVERMRSWSVEMKCAWLFDLEIPVTYDDTILESKESLLTPSDLEYWFFLLRRWK